MTGYYSSQCSLSCSSRFSRDACTAFECNLREITAAAFRCCIRRALICHMPSLVRPIERLPPGEKRPQGRHSPLSAHAQGTTVLPMSRQRSVTHQLSEESGWESLLHSCSPLRIRYAPGEMICQSGSFVAGIHVILHGIVSDRIAQPGIRQPQCDILAVDDLIGLEILTNNSEAFSSSLCRAVTSVELLFIERHEFESALASHPTLQPAVLHYVTARYIEARRTSPASSQLDAQFCRLLLRLATSCNPPAEGPIVTLPAEITLRTLSELLGISSRQLRDIRQSIPSLSRVEAHIVFDSDEVRRMIDEDACGHPGDYSVSSMMER